MSEVKGQGSETQSCNTHIIQLVLYIDLLSLIHPPCRFAKKGIVQCTRSPSQGMYSTSSFSCIISHINGYAMCYMLFKHMAQYTYRILNIWVAMVIFENHFHYIKVAMLRSIVQWCLAQLQMVRNTYT